MNENYDDQKARRHGDRNAIICGLLSSSSLYKLQAISGSINNRVFDDAIKEYISNLTNDHTVIMGYKISQLATAALCKFGIIDYSGDDSTILNLVQADKWFDR